MALELKTVRMEKPEDVNLILGQTHFIKSVEDLYEAMTTASAAAKFGIAFCESSGECLVRVEGNDDELRRLAAKNALSLSAGHVFIILMRNAYPINVLNAVKAVPEVACVFCATANPVEVIVAETESGRGVLGVIDGAKSRGVEGPEGVMWRKELLRKIGYKL